MSEMSMPSFQDLDGVRTGRLAVTRPETGRGHGHTVAGHLAQQALRHRAAAHIAGANKEDVFHRMGTRQGPRASVMERAPKSIWPPRTRRRKPCAGRSPLLA